MNIAALLLFMSIGVCHAIAGDTPAGKDLSAQARRLLREAPLVEGHNDLPWQYRKFDNNLDAIEISRDTRQVNAPIATDIPRLHAGCVGGQFWSVYIPPTTTGPAAVQAVLEQIDVVYRLCERYPNDLELARTADDVERIAKTGKIASLIGMEGGQSIDNSLAMLRMMHALGARYMTLTHIKSIDWADSANDAAKSHGLSAFGEQVIAEMNRLGMLADLSHVSDDTARHVLRITKAPVIFSHSNCRALCNNIRNVPDDILRQLRDNGGVIMINFVPDYLSDHADMHSNPASVTFKNVADHIDHACRIAGVDHVGIGADFEGFSTAPQGLEDVSAYPALFGELLRRGYSKAEIKKIAGRNMLRVLRKAEEISAELRKGK